tara:strand:+ start:1888 stop:2289 length:402 start_codon:yes stop_codon:yes gene_type:complete
MAGIGFRMPANSVFFNTREIDSSLDKAEKRVLSRFGFETRKDAKSSMRRRRQPSGEGSPPRVVTGLLKRFIFFSYDRFKKSVVTGPARITGFKGAGDAPEALEHGKLNRPFMTPAFTRQLDEHMPDMWKNSIR